MRVVVGHRADELTPVLELLGIKWIFNAEYDRGMFSSVLAGIKSFEPDVDAFFLLPCDIRWLILKRSGRSLVFTIGTIQRLSTRVSTGSEDILHSSRQLISMKMPHLTTPEDCALYLAAMNTTA